MATNYIFQLNTQGRGARGLSAYQVAVANGYEGTEEEWLASLVGPEGPEGPEGPQGDDGPQGPAGDPASVTAANTLAALEAMDSGQQADARAAMRAAHDSLSAEDADKAEFWDDFHRADTAAGVVSDAPTGQTYQIRDGAGNVGSGPVQISGNKLNTTTAGQTWYIGGNFLPSGKVRNMGAIVRWKAPPGSPTSTGFTQMVFIIKPDSAWLDELIHVRFNRYSCVVEVATSGGAAGLTNIAEVSDTNYSPATYFRPADGVTEAAFEVIIEGDRLTMLCDGTTIVEVTDSRIGAINGSYVYWESYQGGQYDQMDVMRIWANDLRMGGNVPGQRVMPFSGFLKRISNGQLFFRSGGSIAEGNLTVSKGTVAADSFRPNINRALGASTIGRAVARVYGTQPNVGNTAGGADTDLASFTVGAYVMGNNGDRVTLEFLGSYAANGNTKTLKYNWVGTDIFTVSRTTSGGAWRLLIHIWKTASNNFNFHFELTDNGGVTTGTHAANTTNAVNLAHVLRGASSGASDVVLRAYFGNHETGA